MKLFSQTKIGMHEGYLSLDEKFCQDLVLKISNFYILQAEENEECSSIEMKIGKSTQEWTIFEKNIKNTVKKCHLNFRCIK